MISFDFESGNIFIGQTSVPVRLTEQDSYLHLNYPDGPVLRPLTVLERLRHMQYAMQSQNSTASLAASILHEATVKPGIGNNKIYAAVALHMAGAGIQAPPVYESISLVAKHTGWDPGCLFASEAAQVDRIAASLKPATTSNWTQLLMLDNAQDEAELYADNLAESLLHRLDTADDLNAGTDFQHVHEQSDTNPSATDTRHDSLLNNERNVAVLKQHGRLTEHGAFNDTAGLETHKTGTSDKQSRRGLAATNLGQRNRDEIKPRLFGPLTTSERGQITAGLSTKQSVAKTTSSGLQIRKLVNNETFSDLESQSSSKQINQAEPNIDTPELSSHVEQGQQDPAVIVALDQQVTDMVFTLSRLNSRPQKNALGLETRQAGYDVQPGSTESQVVDYVAPQTAVKPFRLNEAASQRSVMDVFAQSNSTAGHTTPNILESTDHPFADVAGFFGQQEKTIADDLAYELNREADLRGID